MNRKEAIKCISLSKNCFLVLFFMPAAGVWLRWLFYKTPCTSLLPIISAVAGLVLWALWHMVIIGLKRATLKDEGETSGN